MKPAILMELEPYQLPQLESMVRFERVTVKLVSDKRKGIKKRTIPRKLSL